MSHRFPFQWIPAAGLVLAAACLMRAQTAAQSSQPSGQAPPPSARAIERLVREVRHEILMQPYYGVFDFVQYQVNGYRVTLSGQVTQPTLKTNIERAVKGIEGVEGVDNKIEVLPLSAMDDNIRRALFRAIYGYGPLERYAINTIAPIRLIVKNGNVTIEGVVNSEGDKNMVGIRANSVPGAFSVKNNLHVEKG